MSFLSLYVSEREPRLGAGRKITAEPIQDPGGGYLTVETIRVEVPSDWEVARSAQGRPTLYDGMGEYVDLLVIEGESVRASVNGKRYLLKIVHRELYDVEEDLPGDAPHDPQDDPVDDPPDDPPDDPEEVDPEEDED